MKLTFDQQLTVNLKSASQKARVLTEQWVYSSIFCPNCGKSDMEKYPNNQPVADFYCSYCREEYELKSTYSTIGKKILDGAYHTMLTRLRSRNNPNLFLLNYDLATYHVANFFVIPKYFFVPAIIEERKPLAPTARRAGWIGCNILLNHIPQAGKIFFVREGKAEQKKRVLAEWKRTLFLREEKRVSAKGWLLDVMACVEKLGRKDFSLDAAYAFESELYKKHPDNQHIKDKIRQQLQVLRDRGYLEFVGRGRYRLT